MARSQLHSVRKVSGGRYHKSRSKKQYELAGYPTSTKLSEKTKIKSKRVLGSNTKLSVLSTNKISVSDKKGKTSSTELINVVENPANPHLIRRNILTKGAIVETKLGKAKITSRPGQCGSVHGKLL